MTRIMTMMSNASDEMTALACKTCTINRVKESE